MKKARVIIALALGVATLGAGAAFWFGLMVSIGGPSPLVRRARNGIANLQQPVPLEALALTARTTPDAHCRDKHGVSCSSDGFGITWSVCAVSQPEAVWTRTRRTDTCDPKDEEEGVAGWSQEPVVTTSIAGYDGFIVHWWPDGFANRGQGCSFRGYRNDERRGWTVLHIEASPGCNEKLLAMMLSTEATGAQR